MKQLHETIKRDFRHTDENQRILEAYDRICRGETEDKTKDEGAKEDDETELTEDSAKDANGTLSAILASLAKAKGPEAKEMLKMAKGMRRSFEKNNGFSKDQAEWIYKTSKALFKK